MKMIDHMGKRLEKAMLEKGVDKNTVAKEFGVKVPSVYDWLEHGRIAKKHLPKLQSYFGGTLEWWLDGDRDVPAFIETDEELQLPAFLRKNGDQPANRLKDVDLDEIEIPQLDTGGGMGRGLVLKDQPGIVKRMVFNREWLGKNLKNYTSEANLCLVTGFGDSMRPMYSPGDPLVVDKGVTSVDYDGVYYFRVEDEGFIKRLQRVPGVGLVAISENKAYKDWTISKDMDFQVFGRVLRAWSSSDY